MAASVKPIHVVDLLNRLYTVMDYCASLFPLYKVETIGDAYMVVGGLPERIDQHALAIADFAVLVKEAVKVQTLARADLMTICNSHISLPLHHPLSCAFCALNPWVSYTLEAFRTGGLCSTYNKHYAQLLRIFVVALFLSRL